MKKKLIVTILSVILGFSFFTAIGCTQLNPNLPECKHESSEWVIDKEATCTNDGVKHSVCSICGEILVKQKPIPALKHNYENGVCTRCGEFDPNVTPTPTSDEYFTFALLKDGTYSIAAKNTNDIPSVVVIPSTHDNKAVTTIDYNAFSDCSSLTSITIPNSVTSIRDYAFWFCSGLTSITIPNSVTNIGGCAFFNCSRLLEKIEVGKGNTKYHSDGNCLIETETKTLILGCKNSVIPSDGSISSIDFAAFVGCSGLTSITIPNSVTNIGGCAFNGCNGLTSITIPNSVTSIDSQAFSSCNGLENIEVENGNAKYHSDGNCLIETETKTLISGCKNSVIPSDGSVTHIDGRAFNCCSGLKSITIPNGVTNIGAWAFDGCGSLTSITIPKSVTSISETAFQNCGGLEKIEVENNNKKYHSDGNCLIETETKTLISGCKNSVIPSDGSVTSIGIAAFWGCSGLKSITIPNSITSIGYCAFSSCSALTSIKFEGTTEQWNAISKDSDWEDDVPATKVECSNGTVIL